MSIERDLRYREEHVCRLAEMLVLAHVTVHGVGSCNQANVNLAFEAANLLVNETVKRLTAAEEAQRKQEVQSP